TVHAEHSRQMTARGMPADMNAGCVYPVVRTMPAKPGDRLADLSHDLLDVGIRRQGVVDAGHGDAVADQAGHDENVVILGGRLPVTAMYPHKERGTGNRGIEIEPGT